MCMVSSPWDPLSHREKPLLGHHVTASRVLGTGTVTSMQHSRDTTARAACRGCLCLAGSVALLQPPSPKAEPLREAIHEARGRAGTPPLLVAAMPRDTHPEDSSSLRSPCKHLAEACWLLSLHPPHGR